MKDEEDDDFEEDDEGEEEEGNVGADPPKSLFFTCGHVVSREVTVIPAQYNAMPDDDISRVALRFADEWAYHDVDTDVIGAVTFRAVDNSLWLLGRHGIVRTASTGTRSFKLEYIRGKFREEKIPAGKFGELLCIRLIGNDLYVCGQSSQVYIRSATGWSHMDEGMFKMAAPTLESIDGTGPGDIYAVGEKGIIVHFDGKRWRKLDSPTNRPLSTVRCVSKDEVYICGNDGLLFRGNKDSWEFIGDEEIDYNFWDLEMFQDKIYLAHVAGMVVFDGVQLSDVDFNLGEDISCHKLHANDGVLWSFGVDDLLFQDGQKWTRVICPHNI